MKSTYIWDHEYFLSFSLWLLHSHFEKPVLLLKKLKLKNVNKIKKHKKNGSVLERWRYSNWHSQIEVIIETQTNFSFGTIFFFKSRRHITLMRTQNTLGTQKIDGDLFKVSFVYLSKTKNYHKCHHQKILWVRAMHFIEFESGKLSTAVWRHVLPHTHTHTKYAAS